jgi:hypothetical protein
MSDTCRDRFQRLRSFAALFGAVLLTTVMLAWAPADAGATPAFCSDIKDLPPRVLTGCHGGANPMAPGLLREGEAPTDQASLPDPTVTMMVVPDIPSVVRVGRSALGGDPSADGRAPQPASASLSESSGGGTPTAEAFAGPSLGPLSRDENWYYLQFNRDGTYLFFGESAETNEQIPFAADEDGLPDGIGLGHKWRF